MWPSVDSGPRWQRVTQRILTVLLALAGFYVMVEFIQRAMQPRIEPLKIAPRRLSPDYYVYPPKSYVRSLADARALAGKPFWVRDGYRWTCTPGPETLLPMEKLLARRAIRRQGQVWLQFDRQGRPCSIPISTGDSFFLDEIFLVRDPREVYKDWKPDTWRKIEQHRAEPGMTEHQINFSVGYGALVRQLSQDGDARRVVDHLGGPQKFRITYEYGIARQVEALR